MHASFAKVLVQNGEHQFLVLFRLEKSIWTGAVSEFNNKTETNTLNVGYCKPPSIETACELVIKYMTVRKRDK